MTLRVDRVRQYLAARDRERENKIRAIVGPIDGPIGRDEHQWRRRECYLALPELGRVLAALPGSARAARKVGGLIDWLIEQEGYRRYRAETHPLDALAGVEHAVDDRQRQRIENAARVLELPVSHPLVTAKLGRTLHRWARGRWQAPPGKRGAAGRRGSKLSAWRGLFVAELDVRLPDTVESRNATIAALLRVGIDADVTHRHVHRILSDRRERGR